MSSLIGTFWRHKARDIVYEIVADKASMQCSAAPEFERLFDDDDWIVYRNAKTGMVWVRPAPEFLDGRFERAETPLGTT